MWSAECRKFICTYKFCLINLFTIPSPHITQPFYWSLHSRKKKKNNHSFQRNGKSNWLHLYVLWRQCFLFFFILVSFEWAMQNKAAVVLVREMPIQSKSIVQYLVLTLTLSLQEWLHSSVKTMGLLSLKPALNNKGNLI